MKSVLDLGFNYYWISRATLPLQSLLEMNPRRNLVVGTSETKVCGAISVLRASRGCPSSSRRVIIGTGVLSNWGSRHLQITTTKFINFTDLYKTGMEVLFVFLKSDQFYFYLGLISTDRFYSVYSVDRHGKFQTWNHETNTDPSSSNIFPELLRTYLRSRVWKFCPISFKLGTNIPFVIVWTSLLACYYSIYPRLCWVHPQALVYWAPKSTPFGTTLL